MQNKGILLCPKRKNATSVVVWAGIPNSDPNSLVRTQQKPAFFQRLNQNSQRGKKKKKKELQNPYWH